MARKKVQPTPAPIPEAFSPLELKTIEQIAAAITSMRSSVAFRLERNRREKALLDRAEFMTQTTLLLLQQVNALQHKA